MRAPPYAVMVAALTLTACSGGGETRVETRQRLTVSGPVRAVTAFAATLPPTLARPSPVMRGGHATSMAIDVPAGLAASTVADMQRHALDEGFAVQLVTKRTATTSPAWRVSLGSDDAASNQSADARSQTL